MVTHGYFVYKKKKITKKNGYVSYKKNFMKIETDSYALI